MKYVFDTPSRTYVDGENTVGKEYDAWTEEGILEYYWGEHIHLGWYSDEELAEGAGTLLGCKKKDFIQAKFDFVDEMAKWSEAEKPAEVLDVGCGIGGTSRHLAKTFGEGTTVTGITLSPNQVKRATELANEQGVPNAQFRVMNALEMEFEDNTFDLVWACESGEHMPDKKAYVEEMVRVLKPGGKIVIATWCQRETPPEFTEKEKSNLKFLYEEWAHPYFISYEEYERLLQGTGTMSRTASEYEAMAMRGPSSVPTLSSNRPTNAVTNVSKSSRNGPDVDDVSRSSTKSSGARQSSVYVGSGSGQVSAAVAGSATSASSRRAARIVRIAQTHAEDAVRPQKDAANVADPR